MFSCDTAALFFIPGPVNRAEGLVTAFAQP